MGWGLGDTCPLWDYLCLVPAPRTSPTSHLLHIRIGTSSKPSAILLERHVLWLDQQLHTCYHEAHTNVERAEFARAGLANTLLWISWLRSSEAFGLCFDDVAVIHPNDGASAELPPGCGAVTLTLLPETKGNRTACGDVVMAYHTAGGFSVGRWFRRLRHALNITHDSGDGQAKLFTSPTGKPWTSRYFRHTYLYPALLAQRAAGDPHLSQFDDSPGKSLVEQFWSVSRRKVGLRRKASQDEVYEHGRWRRRRVGEAVDVLYREWTLGDRVLLTWVFQ